MLLPAEILCYIIKYFPYDKSLRFKNLLSIKAMKKLSSFDNFKDAYIKGDILSINIMLKYIKLGSFDWYNLSIIEQEVSIRSISKFKHRLFWYSLLQFQQLPEDFILKNIRLIDTTLLVKYQKISENLIAKLIDQFNDRDWIHVFINQNISEKFILEHYRYINWDIMVPILDLSEEFLIKVNILFKPVTFWYDILKFQKLSEEFLNTYKHNFNNNHWRLLYIYQNISYNFINENKEYLYKILKGVPNKNNKTYDNRAFSI
jgi:hypothetical protein